MNRIRLIILAAAAIIGALLIYRAKPQFDWGQFQAIFSQLHWGWFAASFCMVMLTYVGRALRWQVMLRPLQPASSFWGLLSATAIGFTAVVLFGRAGELVRPYLIAVKEKVPFSSQLAAWLLERIYDLLSVLVLFGFALSRITAGSASVGPVLTGVLQTGGHIAGVLATVCLAVLVAFGVFPDLVERRLKGALGLLPAKLRPKLETLVSAFVSGTGSTRRGSFVFMLVAYTFVEWMIIAGCFWCVFRSIPAAAGLTALDTLIIVGFVAFGSAVQLPGVGGGMQVACVLVLTELYQFPLAAATGTAVLLWLISFVSIVPIGLLLMAREGLEFRKLMKRGSMEAL